MLNTAEEPVQKSKTASPSLGAGSTFPRDAASQPNIGGKQKRLLGRKVGQERLGSEPKTRAGLQMELLVAWLCAAPGCLAESGRAA